MNSEEVTRDQHEPLKQVLEQIGLEPEQEHPCSYLPARWGGNLAFSVSRLAPGTYHALMDLNFRRSGTILYRPMCRNCRQCRALRLAVDAFRPNRTQRRCWRRNRELTVDVLSPEPTEEKHQLFRRYLKDRHDRQMDDSWASFCSFLYDSPLETIEVVFRLASRLVAVGIADIEPQAVSTVYCYFDPEFSSRSLGTFNVLWMIDYCRRRKIPYLYLGYYIADCAKMSYKANFKPCEVLDAEGRWRAL